MNEILQQLGGLMLGSVPTIVFFLLLIVAYGLLVRRPLDRVLAERHARTTGALDQARGAISAAEAETAVYEDKLRAAKNEIYQARDERRKQLAAEREQLLSQARAATQQRVGVARKDIESSVIAARRQIESASDELSARIVASLLPAGVESAS